VKGFFITFEGIDGCGKTTIMKRTAAFLKEKGFDVLCTQEPGGSELGSKLRRLLLDTPKGAIDDHTETLLYAADRSLHVSQVILPALAQGKVVLCDRYLDSSYAYQGSGRKIPMEQIRLLNEFAVQGLQPDMTVLLDLPVAVALRRLGKQKDRIEQENIDFFERVAEQYRALAQQEPQRFFVADAALPLAEVAASVLCAVEKFTERR